MMVVVLGLGVIAFGSTMYQRSAFEQTTRQLEMELDASVSLVRELRTIDVAMGSIFYELGTPAELEGHVRTFAERRRTIDAAFKHAHRVLPVRSQSDPLASAEANWAKTARAVMGARELWGTSVVKDTLAAGRDPFTEEWTQLREAQSDLTELTAQSLQALRSRTERVDRVQQVIPPIVLGALIATLMLVAWSVQRLRHRFVKPVLTLRNAAQRMRDGDLQTPVRVETAGSELQDLAQVMNELAGSLHTSYGKLRDQAYTDALTGLPNRKALVEHLSERTGAAPVEGTALLFIDLDDFKFVNDSLGHEAGDRLLTIIAQRLRSSARDGDVIARLGGDEFAIAVDQGHDPATAVSLAERILGALSQPVMVNHTAVTVGCSIGIALSGSIEAAGEELLRSADMAMYMAKSGGKNRLELYSETMHTELVSRMNLKADLAHAVDRNQLELHYQPVIELATDEILGWEALVRWRHPDRGLISPLEFIPTAEETGDILRIGKWVLEQACEDFTNTLAPGRPNCWLSVNVSASQLLGEDFAQTVRQALERCGIDPKSLVLEITEAALVTDTEQAAAMLGGLQRDGIRVAVDDFGTGFSSLRRLQELPVDIIKIDRSFVAMTTGLQSTAMLEAIVTLGKALGLDMIAEGIERRPELETLKRLGGIAGQGYYFARPMPVAEAHAHAQTTATAAPKLQTFTPQAAVSGAR